MIAANTAEHKQKNGRRADPSALRAFCARHSITYLEIAQQRGCTRAAVSQALRADVSGRYLSHDLLNSLWTIAQELLRNREEKAAHGGH